MDKYSKERHKFNSKVAKLLGFKKTPYKTYYSENTYVETEQWQYPEEFNHLRYSSPTLNIPDFYECIIKYLDIMHTANVPRTRWHSGFQNDNN